MPGDVLGSDIETIYYIRSDTAYRIARARGLWEVFRRRIAGKDPYLKSFRESVEEPLLTDAKYLGVQIVATRDIVGSLGRAKEFSRSFLPVGTARQRERWRQSYTRLLSGGVGPPMRVCKAGANYYVVNGHHRVSAARYLNVESIQAHVSDVSMHSSPQVRGSVQEPTSQCPSANGSEPSGDGVRGAVRDA